VMIEWMELMQSWMSPKELSLLCVYYYWWTQD
jgi:hypothetical protein